MSEGWDKYDPAPIETFHSEAIDEFHKCMDENNKIGGIELNNIITHFKMKIYKTYNISRDAVPKSVKSVVKNDSNS